MTTCYQARNTGLTEWAMIFKQYVTGLIFYDLNKFKYNGVLSDMDMAINLIKYTSEQNNERQVSVKRVSNRMGLGRRLVSNEENGFCEKEGTRYKASRQQGVWR